MFGADSLVLEKAVPELGERAFGRIKIVDGAARTVVDEPFALKAAENYFKIQDPDFMKTIEYVLTEAFKTRAFSVWPQEPSIPSLCDKLAGYAEIVGLDKQGLRRGTTIISVADFIDADLHKDSMHNGEAVPPFMFPKAKPSGPDIVFCIWVKDKLFLVFVQLKLRQTMSTSDAEAALKTVTAPAIETHVDDLGSLCPADNTYISMVIAYPATVAQLRRRPEHKYNLRPKPDSEHKRLTQVKVIIDKSNINKVFPQRHIDFLDGIKGRMKRQAVGTPEAENPKKARK
ncbi:hypothetical protein BG003_010314 [Podila horticola]|nr:hypothetical protein BG003_010314 [Podila horticola]